MRINFMLRCESAFATVHAGRGNWYVLSVDCSDALGYELGGRVMSELGCSDAPKWEVVREFGGVPERTISDPQWRPPRPRDPS